MRKFDFGNNIPKIIEDYYSGMSENQIAKSLGTSRGVIRRIFILNNVKIRDNAEANRLMMSRRTPSENKKNTQKAHESIRNKPKKFFQESSVKQAKTKENTLSKVGKLENVFVERMGKFFDNIIPQRAIGKYNIDIFLDSENLAIEVHINSGNPMRNKRNYSKYSLLRSLGVKLVWIWINPKKEERMDIQVDNIIQSILFQNITISPFDYWIIREDGLVSEKGMGLH